MRRFKILPTAIHQGDDGVIVKPADRHRLAVAARPVGHFNARRVFQQIARISCQCIAWRLRINAGC